MSTAKNPALTPFAVALGDYIGTCAVFIANSERAARAFRDLGEHETANRIASVAAIMLTECQRWYAATGGNPAAFQKVMTVAREGATP